MEDFALMPHGAVLALPSNDNAEVVEPIAEHNFARRKLLDLEQGLGRLQKTARQQHEAVSQLESGMKSVVSDQDLRRAIGLAFQEVEARLEDAFADSSRKCLAMFSKREDMAELQALIGKKVNWSEYNAILKKLSELRQYIDTMAGSVFIGHREALNREFAKKADASDLEVGLKSKADWGDVNEVRARLERLESVVQHTETKQAAKFEELRKDYTDKLKAQAERQMALIQESQAVVAAMRQEHAGFVDRLSATEGGIASLGAAARKSREAQEILQEGHEHLRAHVAAMQEQLKRVEDAVGKTAQDVMSLESGAKDFREASQVKFAELSAHGQACKEQLDFLMQAVEMIKRRSREQTKTHTAKFKEVADEQATLKQQMQALERLLKQQERSVRGVEQRALKAAEEATQHGPIAMGGLGMGALKALPPAEDTDPNDRLKGLLEQLEKISLGGSPQELMGMVVDPQRPPLPWGGAEKGGGGKRGIAGGASALDAELAALSRFATSGGQAPIDSARGHSTAASVRGMHSPRTGSASKSPRRKK